MGSKTRDPGKSARRSLKKARGYYRGLKDDIPSVEDLQVDLKSPELQGLLDEISLAEEEEIRIDPSLRQAQMEALAQMRDQTEGFTPEQMAARNELMRGVEASAQARRKAVDQEMAQRGMQSSGSSLIAKLQANEEANQRAAEGTDRLLTQADQARRDALMKSASMASGLEGTDFQRAKGERDYRQAIDQFNKQNRQQTQRFNLGTRQQLENTRANIANQQAMRNAQAHQQVFQNKMGIASGMAGTRGSEAGTYAMRPEKQTSGFGQIAGGVIGGIASAGNPAGIGVGMQAGEAVEGALMEDGGIAGYQDGGQVNPFFKEGAFDQMQKDAMNQRYGIANDKTPEEDMLLEDANKTMGKEDEGMNISMADAAGLLKQFNKSRQPAPQQRMPDTSLSPISVNNILSTQYSDAQYQPPQFEDGGLSEGEKIVEEQKRKVREYLQNRETPMSGQEYIESKLGGGEDAVERMKREVRERLKKNYEDGGTYEDQDGGLEFISDGSGDVVEGDSFERDRVDAKLNSGEMVLNAAQQQRLLDMIRGKLPQEAVGEEDIVEGVPKEYQEELMEDEKDDKLEKGLKKLLNMLGE